MISYTNYRAMYCILTEASVVVVGGGRQALCCIVIKRTQVLQRSSIAETILILKQANVANIKLK